MARAHFAEVAITPDGSFLPNARITTTLRNSITKADMFATDAASSPLPNPYFITDGIVSHWAEAGAYDVLIEDADSPPKVVARKIGWGAVPGVTGGIPGTMIADAAINNARLADLSVGTTKLADASVTNAKVAANAISTATINDGAVTSAKLATGAVSAPNTTIVAKVVNEKFRNLRPREIDPKAMVNRIVTVAASPARICGISSATVAVPRTCIGKSDVPDPTIMYASSSAPTSFRRGS